MDHIRRISFALLLYCLPSVAAAKPVAPSRTAEVIVMSATDASNAGQAEPVAPAASFEGPQKFRLYEIGERPLQEADRDAASNRIAPGRGFQDPPYGSPAVAARSTTPVPGWMMAPSTAGNYQFQASDCAVSAYRPAGFLRPEAELHRVRFFDVMSAVACGHRIPPALFDAMIIQESRYDPQAVSPKSALGLAQLMPATAKELGVDAHDPVQNLVGGARYLRQQLDRFGKVHLALAAYNAGAGRIRGGIIPPIAETRSYVFEILRNWSRLSASSSYESDVIALPRHARSASVQMF